MGESVMSKKLSTEEWIVKAKVKHGDRYDYSKSVYSGGYNKVVILCDQHGEFKQTAGDHTQGKGCGKCAIEKRSSERTSTTEEFVSKAKAVHLERYDYSESVYKKSADSIVIICPIHGRFSQLANNHLAGSGCLKCGAITTTSKVSLTTSEFISKATEVHSNKYDYSKTKYTNSSDKIAYTCYEHGEITQIAADHLYGKKGCYRCGLKSTSKKNSYTKNDFLRKSNEVHSGKYDYSKSVYKTSLDQVTIICPDHGEFYQVASAHLRGEGCSKCSAITGTKGAWIYNAKATNDFKGYTFYLIRLEGNGEIFFKVGITFKGISERFNSKTKMPYSYSVLKEISSSNDANIIFDSEAASKRLIGDSAYSPNIPFGGSTECFRAEDINNHKVYKYFNSLSKNKDLQFSGPDIQLE